MKRLFLSISKNEELRFLGHLDYLRTMERIVVRSGIPIAFSEGFNPHMKISLDSALGVGVTADPLYMELKLEKDISNEAIRAMMEPQLPKGIVIHDILEAKQEWPKFVAFFNEDCYEMEGPVTDGANQEDAEKKIAEFNALSSFLYKRVTPKKIREMDVKPMIMEPMKVRIEGNRAYLTFSLIRSNNGTVQPKDIWKMLSESFDLPWIPDAFICSRTGTYRNKEGKRLTPFDKGVFKEFEMAKKGSVARKSKAEH